MSNSFIDGIKEVLCVIFNHFPKDKWKYKGIHAHCKLCKKTITYANGEWI